MVDGRVFEYYKFTVFTPIKFLFAMDKELETAVAKINSKQAANGGRLHNTTLYSAQFSTVNPGTRAE